MAANVLKMCALPSGIDRPQMIKKKYSRQITHRQHYLCTVRCAAMADTKEKEVLVAELKKRNIELEVSGSWFLRHARSTMSEVSIGPRSRFRVTFAHFP